MTLATLSEVLQPALRDGYAVAVCYGDGHAMRTLKRYFGLGESG